MVRWLLRGGILAGLALSFFVACRAESTGGPPSVECGQAKGSAPVCGKVCANKCGCGECQVGAQTIIDGIVYVCTGKCFSLGSGSGGAGGSGGGSGGSGGGNTGGSAGVDCQGVDCNANPPVCGTCTTCACCNCSNGQLKTIGGQSHICNGGCYSPVTGDGG